MHNPHSVVRMFEENVAEYTGAKYAVACDNCTNAIRMCLEIFQPNTVKSVILPTKTYISVAQSVLQAGYKINWDTGRNNWEGIYRLDPFPVFDAAKRFTRNMYIPETLMCLSFGIKKPLKLGKGGMILTDCDKMYAKLKQKRWSGRTEDVPMDEDQPPFLGYNAYITPEWAAWGMMMLSVYDDNGQDQPKEDYPDLRRYEILNGN